MRPRQSLRGFAGQLPECGREGSLRGVANRHGGRLVLMGSMTTDLPLPYTTVMLNSREIIGQFMYPAGAYRRRLDLLRSGLLDISAIRPRVYPRADLPQATEAATTAGNLECVVMQP
jgi:alcohol dehydrogenase